MRHWTESWGGGELAPPTFSSSFRVKGAALMKSAIPGGEEHPSIVFCDGGLELQQEGRHLQGVWG